MRMAAYILRAHMLCFDHIYSGQNLVSPGPSADLFGLAPSLSSTARIGDSLSKQKF
jgi:hypothetical protein